MFRAIAVASAVMAATASGAVSNAFADDLTQAEIASELVGRQIVWWEDGGWLSGQLTLGPNGTAELSVDHPERQIDIGSWVFRDGELCTEWTRMRSGAEKCYSVRRGEQGRFLTSGGNVFEVREAGV